LHYAIRSPRRTALLLAALAGCGGANVEPTDAARPDAAVSDASALDAAPQDVAVADAAVSDAAPSDGSAQDDVGAAIEWTRVIPGTYQGTEVSATQGTVRATYAIEWSASDARYLVRLAGRPGSPKLYFVGVDVDPTAPTTGFLTLPEQVYSPGGTGPVTLNARGSGQYPAAGLGRSFDGTYDTATRTLSLRGRITVQPGGQSEAFTFTFTP
jgi:hypothetical protein